MDKDIDKR